MVGIVSIETVQAFQAKKECTPLPSKLTADFNPYSFNSGIPSRSERSKGFMHRVLE